MRDTGGSPEVPSRPRLRSPESDRWEDNLIGVRHGRGVSDTGDDPVKFVDYFD